MYPILKKVSVCGVFASIFGVVIVAYRVFEAGLTDIQTYMQCAILLGFIVPWLCVYYFCDWKSRAKEVELEVASAGSRSRRGWFAPVLNSGVVSAVVFLANTILDLALLMFMAILLEYAITAFW